MKKILKLLSVIMLASLIAIPVVSNAASGPPRYDAWVEVANPDTPNSGTNLDNLWVRASTLSCTPDRVTYLQWDLSDVPVGAIINSAALSLYVNGVSGDFSIPRNVTLYQLLNDDWNESVTWNQVNPGTTPGAGPNLGPAIQTIGVLTTGTITFTNSNLVSYLQSQADGDKIASFALEMTDNCTAGSTGVRFDSKDKTNGISPQLIIQNPNAVSISNLTTDTPAPTWPLYAGLAALVVIAAAGVAWSRRRAMQR